MKDPLESLLLSLQKEIIELKIGLPQGSVLDPILGLKLSKDAMKLQERNQLELIISSTSAQLN